jgi:diacylglycerol kinase
MAPEADEMAKSETGTQRDGWRERVAADRANAVSDLSDLHALFLSKRRARAFLRSFANAYLGILEVLATQRNMVVHCVIAIPTLIATQLLGFETTENIVVLFCVALVLACELINTSIENIGDVISPDYHPSIRRAKDAAAGMVLISAIASAAIGIILFTREGRLGRLMRWDVSWNWLGSVDNVLITLILIGHCWLFVHVWIYRRRAARAERSINRK